MAATSSPRSIRSIPLLVFPARFSLTRPHIYRPNFVQFLFTDGDEDCLSLVFQTTLGSFTGGSLHTSFLLTDSTHGTFSLLGCVPGVSDCVTSSGYSAFFASGNATLVSQVSPTPLPAALPLFAGGLGLVGFLARRKKRKATPCRRYRTRFRFPLSARRVNHECALLTRFA
jgi:hypothetical protein